MQAYRDLRVLTARPSPRTKPGFPPAVWLPRRGRSLVGRTVEEFGGSGNRLGPRAGKLPIVVGGTGLYLSTLTEASRPSPPFPKPFATQPRSLYERLGGTAFRDALADLDPEAAGRISPTDRQRLLRAWEVFQATGRPLSAWQADTIEPADAGRFAAVILLPPRAGIIRRH